MWLASIVVLTAMFVRRTGDDAESNSISLGMSTVLTGPSAQLGIEMRTGVELAIRELNTSGGVHKKVVRLVALDDGYEPQRTVPNMRTLLDEHRVLAIVGNVGTPTAVSAVPLALDRKTLFFGAFTGAGILRKNPPDRYVINFRASYAEETAAMVNALINNAGLKAEEIAFFTQRDAYGDSGFAGGVAALRKHGVQDEASVAHGRYERNTIAVEPALADLLQAEIRPRAVIMVGAYSPCAAFIKLARKRGLNALFLNVSFVGTQALAQELGNDESGVVVTQVVPHFESDLPIVKDYRQALNNSVPPPKPSFGSLEGYVAMRILSKALVSAPQPPNRESLVDALEKLGKFELGLGDPLELTSSRHQASARVWPTVIRSGTVKPLEWSQLQTLLPEKAR